mmetsp:Transcript_43407/g.98060  ORF Transcript_43407/g.98060 Transcript_43407/m.98060 type:complete len:325 (-) Transcript_43407:633-1607(-)
MAADLLRRSGRDLSKADPSETRLLREAMEELRNCWAGNEPSGEWELQRDAGGVSGLNICTNFLDPKEVEALRTLVGSHRAWAQYTYGSTGRHGELASMVQRIDFGPANLPPEGVVGGTPMWRLGSLRAELVQMLGARLQHVFDPVQLWADTEPDTLQLTKIGCAQKLANHWDRRDRWQEGIASLAWSELPSEADLRGDPWVLNMERGSKKELQSVQLTMQPGSAYILVGAAQGCTKSCERRCVGHNRCNCCWTHGILAASNVVRQSMTLRVLADDEDSSSSSSSDDENAGGGGSAGGEGATRSRVAVGADTDADGTQTAGGDDA